MAQKAQNQAATEAESVQEPSTLEERDNAARAASKKELDSLLNRTFAADGKTMSALDLAKEAKEIEAWASKVKVQHDQKVVSFGEHFLGLYNSCTGNPSKQLEQFLHICHEIELRNNWGHKTKNRTDMHAAPRVWKDYKNIIRTAHEKELPIGGEMKIKDEVKRSDGSIKEPAVMKSLASISGVKTALNAVQAKEKKLETIRKNEAARKQLENRVLGKEISPTFAATVGTLVNLHEKLISAKQEAIADQLEARVQEVIKEYKGLLAQAIVDSEVNVEVSTTPEHQITEPEEQLAAIQ